MPDARMKDYKFPAPELTRSPGHYRDWIRACKGGEQACSNFSVAAPFVEWMLLGIIALKHEGKLEWDAAQYAHHESAGSKSDVEAEISQELEVRLKLDVPALTGRGYS